MAGDAKGEGVELKLPSSDEVKLFYAHVGQAITVWSLVEDELYSFAEDLIEPKRAGVLMSAFHSMQTTGQKLQFVDAAVRPVLEHRKPELLPDWLKLRKSIDESLRRRNELAHFRAFTYEGHGKKKPRIVLRPLLLDGRYMAGVKKYVEHPISAVRGISKRFNELAKEMHEFRIKIPEYKKKEEV